MAHLRGKKKTTSTGRYAVTIFCTNLGNCVKYLSYIHISRTLLMKREELSLKYKGEGYVKTTVMLILRMCMRNSQDGVGWGWLAPVS